MKERTFSFKDWQVPLVSLNLQMENNTFLRVLLDNQLKIMDKLGMDLSFDHLVMNDLMPVHKHKDIPTYYENYLENINAMTSFLREKSWEFAQMRLSQIDAEPEEE